MDTLLTAIEAHPWPAFWLAFFCIVALWAVFGGIGRRAS